MHVALSLSHSSLSSYSRSRPGVAAVESALRRDCGGSVCTGVQAGACNGQAQFQVEPAGYAFDTLIQIDQRNPQDAQNRYFPLLQKAFGFFIQALALYALLTQAPEISRLLSKGRTDILGNLLTF